MDSKKSVFDCAWAFGTLMTQASQSASGNADWKFRWRMSGLGIEWWFYGVVQVGRGTSGSTARLAVGHKTEAGSVGTSYHGPAETIRPS